MVQKAMPTYVYECDTCSKVFEVDQRITEDPLTDCGCGDGKVKRIMQPTAVMFKGSGFYVNDVTKSSASPASSGPSCDGSGACPSCVPES